MNTKFLQDPLYKGIAFILVGTLLLYSTISMPFIIINILVKLLFVALSGGLIIKGLMLAGLDKPIMALYHKTIKK